MSLALWMGRAIHKLGVKTATKSFAVVAHLNGCAIPVGAAPAYAGAARSSREAAPTGPAVFRPHETVGKLRVSGSQPPTDPFANRHRACAINPVHRNYSLCNIKTNRDTRPWTASLNVVNGDIHLTVMVIFFEMTGGLNG
jgi:hypothetical protein